MASRRSLTTPVEDWEDFRQALKELPSIKQSDQDNKKIQWDSSEFDIDTIDSTLELINDNRQVSLSLETIRSRFRGIGGRRTNNSNLNRKEKPESNCTRDFTISSVDDYATEFSDTEVSDPVYLRFKSSITKQGKPLCPTIVQEARYRANLFEQELLQHDSSWLRTSLFRSRCMVNGKIIDFVIDSGGSRKLISEEIVRNLALRTESHPTPYCM
ncbi:unnamed protein product [Arabis nemorensis]|uniref:Uncharacterized protein n=1 Tax=Arabis nemorensis TaxID=586526 RepID=A0A565C3Z3_9BRAS|nr:unnamed protein product [Arabis nemorensis]